MSTTSEILESLRRIRPDIERRYGVRKLALFGSYAREGQVDGSDVDILVDVDPSIGLDFVTLADELEEVLGERVDLVSVRSVKPRQMDEILPDLIDV